VDRDARNRNARLLLADCYLQQGQDEDVVVLLSGRDGEFGDDRLFAYVLGNALLRRNEVERGQVYIDRLFREGDTAEARLLMGVAQLRREDFRAALAEIERARELNPSLPTVHSFHGRALLGMGRREEATAAFRKELERNANDFDSNLYLGLLLKDEGKLDESLDRLKRADRLRPSDPRVVYGLGALHLAAGRVDDAQRALEALVQQVPDYTQGHVLLATIYYRQKNKELAERERAIVEKLRSERQALEPGASDELGPAYRGELLPEEKPPAPPKKPEKP
jgi:tetratricopeptide (TPR) repeat protein